ncbi:excalibur calcium-binding domain-containing protein [Arthrobacter sp. D2-10]
MNKKTAGLAVAAAAGFVALSATPASAGHFPFPNCDAAAALGVYNIPIGTPGYAAHLDSDSDGVGCESATVAYNPNLVVDHPTTPPQVPTVPVGGAATGVEVTQQDNTAALALGGGFVLAMVAGGAYVVRRRSV